MTRPARLPLAQLVAMASLLGACGDGDTGVVVEVFTTCDIPADIDTLKLRVWNSAGDKLPDSASIGLNAQQSRGRLAQVGLAPDEQIPTKPIMIEAVGMSDGVEAVMRKAMVTFLRGKVEHVSIVLEKECLHYDLCERTNQTCEVVAGMPRCVDPGILPPIAPSSPGRDGGDEAGPIESRPPYDGAVAPGSDAGVTDGSNTKDGVAPGPQTDTRAPGLDARADRSTPADAPSTQPVDAPVTTLPPDAPVTTPPLDAPVVTPPPDAPVVLPPDAPPPPILRAQGERCSAGAECASTLCVDGVCCNGPCTARCQSCVQLKSGAPDGTCASIPAGQDPDDECGRDDPSTCGGEGSCNGAGACRQYPAGSVCAPARCESNSHFAASTCNGQGTCLAPGAEDCGLSRCAPGGCPRVCGNQEECAAGAFCDLDNGSSCKRKFLLGIACKHDYECESGHCLHVLLGVLCSLL